MKIAIFGAGAVGGHIAGRLMSSGTAVSVVARGAQLAAIRARGLTVIAGDERMTADPVATDRPDDLGEQDIVVVSVKGPGLPAALDAVGPMIGRQTRVIFAMNGLPWWFLDGLPIAMTPELKYDLDPTDRMDEIVPRERAAACVVTSGGRVVEPGVIENTTPKINSLTLGFFDGRDDLPVRAFAAAATRAGYRSELVPNIRETIWAKLFVNASAAMLAALVQRSTADTLADPEVRKVASACVEEVIAIGRAIGITLKADPAAIVDGMSKHHHRPSILQDMEAGRPLEIDNVILAVRDIARAKGIAAPHLTTVAALIGARAADVAKARA